MVTRRKVQREDRRRRVLRDDPAQPMGVRSSKRAKKPATDARLYSDAALHGSQPRVTDLIPTRLISVAACFLLGLLGIAVVLGLFLVQPGRDGVQSAPDAWALGLAGPGTLAAWYGSLTLGLAALVCLMIFHLRRYKVDDYRGRYRLWLWGFAALVLASADTCTAVHRMLRTSMMKLTGETLWGNGAIWWVLGWVLVSLMIGTRVVIDTRRSWGTLFWTTLATAAYTASAIIYLGVVQMPEPEIQLMAQTGLGLLAHHLLLVGLICGARYFYLEAQGELHTRRQRKKNGRQEATSERRGWFGRKTSDKATNRKPAGTRTKRAGVVRLEQDDEHDDDDKRNLRRRGTRSTVGSSENSSEVTRQDESNDLNELELLTDPDLSKTERRKLRKELRRRQRRAA